MSNFCYRDFEAKYGEKNSKKLNKNKVKITHNIRIKNLSIVIIIYV